MGVYCIPSTERRKLAVVQMFFSIENTEHGDLTCCLGKQMFNPGGGGDFLVVGKWVCATGWGCIFTTGY